MLPRYSTRPDNRDQTAENHGLPGSLSAADAGIVLDPGVSVRRADHPDSASHSPLCLYAGPGSSPGQAPSPPLRYAKRREGSRPHPGHSLTEAEIHAHCAANLAHFKRPYAIKFVDALPRNATGKIHKPTLRQNFGASKATDAVNAATLSSVRA
jgi:AMP-binding enzyme C-terminal domain